jgi:hypothetical protein
VTVRSVSSIAGAAYSTSTSTAWGSGPSLIGPAALHWTAQDTVTYLSQVAENRYISRYL